MSISVLILTLNEEATLPRLLEKSQGVSDDIVVLDSLSTDATRDVSRRRGCRVYERAFDTERDQRAFGNTRPFKYPWTYNSDADEIADELLIEEMRRAATAENPGARQATCRVIKQPGVAYCGATAKRLLPPFVRG